MELKDRIQLIMNKERLSASVFADSIGVQRSSISHIISGRNKPSLEFIQKVLTSYPKYSSEWLIMGKGAPVSEQETNSLFNNMEQVGLKVPKEPKNSLEREHIGTKLNAAKVSDEDEPLYSKKSPEVEALTHKNSFNAQENTKTIDKIVVFYSDNTFDLYNAN